MRKRSDISDRADVRIEPWGSADLPLLERCLGDPEMMQHLGGPESPEKIAERQARYEQPDSKQFKIVLEVTGEGVGWVGYWEHDWQGEQVYEIGWSVLPAFQGRGVAAAGASERALERPLPEARLHAARPARVEYPKGRFMQCNDWRLDLSTMAPAPRPSRP